MATITARSKTRKPQVSRRSITVFFVNTIINFLIVAFVISMLIKNVNRLVKKKEVTPAAPHTLPREIVLLEEIRDILKKR